MSNTASTAPAASGVVVDRKPLLAALERLRAVALNRCPRPILTGVRLQAADGELHLAATDGELKLYTQIEAAGRLPGCVVSCAELALRVKTARSAACTLAPRARPPRLVVQGGRGEHTLPTLPADDFPPIPDRHQGDSIALDAAEFRARLAAVSPAMAREPSRYALHGVLLESDADGVRLVATDGRRLVTARLERYETTFRGQLLLPARVATLIQKFAAHETVPLVVAAKANATTDGQKLPADLYVAGPGWLLSAPEVDGRFPLYRDVIPPSQSKFAVDRQRLAEALADVALATSDDSRMVRVDLTPRRIQLSASSPKAGEATARLPATFLGGGDRTIHTAFNPTYLRDALQSLDGPQVVLDVAQNGCGLDGKVFGKPALLYAHGDAPVRWVVMPVDAGLAATRENLGSNYREEAA